jgi:hypothetical protein
VSDAEAKKNHTASQRRRRGRSLAYAPPPAFVAPAPPPLSRPFIIAHALTTAAKPNPRAASLPRLSLVLAHPFSLLPPPTRMRRATKKKTTTKNRGFGVGLGNLCSWGGIGYRPYWPSYGRWFFDGFFRYNSGRLAWSLRGRDGKGGARTKKRPRGARRGRGRRRAAPPLLIRPTLDLRGRVVRTPGGLCITRSALMLPAVNGPSSVGSRGRA